jgi:hypothetical protein
MTRRRRWIVNLFLGVLVAGSLYDIVRDQEHWPFSQYPMFSGVWRDTSFSWYRLVGVEPDGKELILDDRRYIQPFDQSRMHLALVRLAQGAGWSGTNGSGRMASTTDPRCARCVSIGSSGASIPMPATSTPLIAAS